MEREGYKILHCFASECCLCVWQEIFLLDWELFDQRPLFDKDTVLSNKYGWSYNL